MRRFFHTAWIAAAAAVLSFQSASAQPTLLNFAHLDRLSEDRVVNGIPARCIHVYANFPDYRWVTAAESGPEGIACVDDAARAAVVCLRAFELRRDFAMLVRARGYLRFVLAMEAPDGEFCNFIYENGSINTTGVTSRKSFGWWGTRGLWALATGARVFALIDPCFSDSLKRAVALTFPHIRDIVDRTDSVVQSAGYRIPRWLPYGSGADVSSELLLGLCEYHRAYHDTATVSLIRRIAAGIMIMQDGDAGRFPFGLHRSWETSWHMWGNSQSCALVQAGDLLHDTMMVASARREAEWFYPRLLIKGFLKEIDLAEPNRAAQFDQIAYCVRPMVLGLLRVYDNLHDRKYAIMAGLAASWLLGNNAAGATMYSSSTGRCFDGIRDSATINLNSGAESTIEALYTLLEVEAAREASPYLAYRKTAWSEKNGLLWGLFRADGRKDVVLLLDTTRPSVEVMEGDAAKTFLDKWNTIKEDRQ